MNTITPTSVPAAQGVTRYRLYTVEHLPFGALPSYRDGGPAKVALPGWAVSTSTVSRLFSSSEVVADGTVTLNLRQYQPDTFDYTPHALDKTTYPTQADADRASYEVGASAYMVYDRDAADWGLPTE